MKILLANFTKMVDDSGGLAKVTCKFANEMYQRGHEVVLVYSDEQSGEFYYPINRDILQYDLRNMDGKRVNYPLTIRLKREWYRMFNKQKARTINNEFAEKYLLIPLGRILEETQPDVIVSFQPAATKLLVMDLNISIPVVTMSHGDPEDYFHFYPTAEIPAVEKCAMNQVLLPSFKEHLLHHLPNAKVTVIGNAIPQYKEQVDLNRTKEIYRIGFLARLSKNHKQPHLLIEAFCKLADEFPNWELVLWGAKEGEAFFKQMELIISAHGLQDRIYFAGSTNNVEDALASCDIFAFPSAYEGFGLSLGEAMSKGLPAVGFASCSAVNELIIDGYNGILCEDGVDGLAQGLKKLMANQALRAEYGMNANTGMKVYAPDRIWDQWEQLLNNINTK
ncbi:glycosyltransferase [Veillonella sp. VA141]|uniref:glycosyltransferase n=1 Tax=Veillonella sp. VA141 TaxID=741833 RepID=UPI000F8F1FEC|nr:glycosyltransferase [Veillonella sp. VA141]